MKLVHSFQQVPAMKENLLKWSAAPEARGLSLESFLIKPVQRICKYPLLIRELEKYSEKSGNVKDVEFLKKAAEKIEKVVKSVNEATRAAEEVQRILSISSIIESPEPLDLHDKVHLKDGMMIRIIKGKPQDRYIVLYTDLILISKLIVTGLRGPPKYELENGYSLAELTFKADGKETIKGLKNTNILAFNIISEEKDTLILATATPEDLLKWVDVFHTAFKDITEEHRSAVRSMDTIRQSSAPVMSIGRSTKLAKGGLSSIAMRKAASRKSQMDWMVNVDEPDSVKIGGVVHKKGLSATGHTFYFNTVTKHSIWKLPEDFSADVPNAETVQPVETVVVEAEEEEGVQLDAIEGFPNWRRVDRGDEMPYYFHVLTQETRWDFPILQ